MFLKQIPLLLVLSVSIWPGLDASQCNFFQTGLLCSLDPISNIVGAFFDLENEIDCQKQCESNIDCNEFLFATFESDRTSECFLLSECSTNTSSCENTPGCSFSVTGPKSPKITDACCDDFQAVTCETDSEIGHFYDIADPPECQKLCRDGSGCRYWSLYGEICFLYSNCSSPDPCSTFCTSGSVLPEISFCRPEQIFHTLLMGGWTSEDKIFTNSVELISPNLTCAPLMDQLPVARSGSAATMLGPKIMFCGGFDGFNVHASCLSWDTDTDDMGWSAEASILNFKS